MDFGASEPRRREDVEHQREPCPHRIIDDVGGAYSMGAIGGSIWHSVKGARNSPRGARLLGAVDAVKLRAPKLGGAFAVWVSFGAEERKREKERESDYWIDDEGG